MFVSTKYVKLLTYFHSVIKRYVIFIWFIRDKISCNASTITSYSTVLLHTDGYKNIKSGPLLKSPELRTDKMASKVLIQLSLLLTLYVSIFIVLFYNSFVFDKIDFHLISIMEMKHIEVSICFISIIENKKCLRCFIQ